MKRRWNYHVLTYHLLTNYLLHLSSSYVDYVITAEKFHIEDTLRLYIICLFVWWLRGCMSSLSIAYYFTNVRVRSLFQHIQVLKNVWDILTYLLAVSNVSMQNNSFDAQTKGIIWQFVPHTVSSVFSFTWISQKYSTHCKDLLYPFIEQICWVCHQLQYSLPRCVVQILEVQYSCSHKMWVVHKNEFIKMLMVPANPSSFHWWGSICSLPWQSQYLSLALTLACMNPYNQPQSIHHQNLNI